MNLDEIFFVIGAVFLAIIFILGIISAFRKVLFPNKYNIYYTNVFSNREKDVIESISRDLSNKSHESIQDEIESYDLYLERLDLIKNEYNELKLKLEEMEPDIANYSERDVNEVRTEYYNLLTTLNVINNQISKLNEQGYYNNKGNLVRDLNKTQEFSEEVLSLIYDLKEKVIRFNFFFKNY